MTGLGWRVPRPCCAHVCYNARIASTTFTLRLPSELKERLEQLAQAAGRSKAFLALDAV
ncbi:MAG: CopG family ribbon-helix-helix protein, partial [Chloroflexota bacterium]